MSYHVVMENPNQTPAWKTVLGAVVLLAFFVVPVWEHWLVTLVVAGPFAGLLFIWQTVRQLNRRDDPRFAKRPAEDP